MFKKSVIPTAGFSNTDAKTKKQRFVSFLRSNLFIPDPRKGWKRYAVNKAAELIETEGIKHVITTSPPHSVQLIGLALKKKYGSKIRWVSDFRDPWTDIYYYQYLNHSKWSRGKDAKYEKSVVEAADHLITVTDLFKQSYLSKSDKIDSNKISIIPNGYDQVDFDEVGHVEKESNFTITYTGTMSDYYDPYSFIDALSSLMTKNPDEKITFRTVGIISDTIRKYIEDKMGNRAEFLPVVKHHDAIRYMMSAHVLLLVTQGEKGTIPGKTFEYLASGSRIISVGSGASSDIVEGCKAGKGFDRTDKEGMKQYLEACLTDFKNGESSGQNTDAVKAYSRIEQAKAVAKAVCDRV